MPFTVITDHASLKWLMDQRDLTGRLARWSLKLQSFNLSIEYRKGSLNSVPDALSRMFSDEVSGVSNHQGKDIDLDPITVPWDSPEFTTEEYKKNMEYLIQCSDYGTNVKIQDNKIFINLTPGNNYYDTDLSSWKLVIPQTLTKTLIYQAHNSRYGAHLGISKIVELLRRQF